MNLYEKWFFVELGLLCGISLPYVQAALRPILPRGESGEPSPFRQWARWVLPIITKYLTYAACTVVLSLIVTMLSPRAGIPIETQMDAFFVGFIADAIIAKFTREKPIGVPPEFVATTASTLLDEQPKR